MSAQLVEAQERQARADRECGAMRDGIKSLKEVWGREVRGLKEDVKKREEESRSEKEEMVSCLPQLQIGAMGVGRVQSPPLCKDTSKHKVADK